MLERSLHHHENSTDAGRSQLSDNFKAQFRSGAMMITNYENTAEIYFAAKGSILSTTEREDCSVDQALDVESRHARGQVNHLGFECAQEGVSGRTKRKTLLC